MPSKEATTANRGRPAISPLFTIERANRALVYVQPIVADLVACYRELSKLREEFQESGDEHHGGMSYRALRGRIARCMEALDRYHRELLEVGCVLKDWRSGLVDFPALRDGRRVWLCWRLGEPQITHWHELHDGFAGRRPTDDRFG